MKKNILMTILSSMFSLFGCSDSNTRIFPDNTEFSKFELSSKINLQKANDIYSSNFESKFKMKTSATNNVFSKVVFIQENIYWIGFIHENDMLGREKGRVWYLMKIDPKTGKILEYKE